MIILIVMPFAALIVAITAVAILRAVRGAQGMGPSSVLNVTAGTDRRTPADEFHDKTWLPMCRRLAEAVRAKANRPLSEKEQRIIWRARSPLVLTVAIQEIDASPDADGVARLLERLPTGLDRPDPTGWCESNSTAK